MHIRAFAGTLLVALLALSVGGASPRPYDRHSDAPLNQPPPSSGDAVGGGRFGGSPPPPPSGGPAAGDRLGDAPEVLACVPGEGPTCAQLDALSSEVRTLRSRLSQVSQRLDYLTKKADVFCQSPTMSANGLGATDSCSPYNCDQVSGRCRDMCRSVDDCAPGFICGLDRMCETLPPNHHE